jgi:hypothetical protein
MKIEFNYKDVYIQDLKVGDVVKTFDIEKEETRHNIVLNTILPIVEKYRQVEVITSDGSKVITSTIHPMCYWDVENNQWDYKKTGLLKVGDILKTEEGQTELVSLTIGLDEDEQFYDIHVARDNNFFAGEDPGKMILVHNSATLYFPWWHSEIREVLVLKNNKGTDDNRVRHIDYGIQFEKIFYQRFIKDETVSIFSPSDVPGLYDTFGLPEFEENYLKFEKNKEIPRKTVKARELMNSFAQERIGTGRMYVMNIDNANNNSPFLERMKMSNLCMDVETSFINSVEVNGSLYDKIQLSELIEMFNDGKEIKVLSKNLDSGDFEFKKVEKAWITKEDADVMEILDDETGFKITCTPDHLIFTKNRGWVEAQYLVESDILDII